MTTPAVTITARQPSRWRCGVQFTGSPQSFPAGHWSEEQLEELRADAQLVVSEEAGGARAGDAGGQPTTPTVQAALETALSALRQATPGQTQEFLQAMEDDPEIRAKIEGVIVARAATEAAAEKREPDAGDAGAEPAREQKIVAAIDGLEKGNKEHWTEGGKPDVFALRKATGLGDISAAERDAAHEAWAEGKYLTGG